MTSHAIRQSAIAALLALALLLPIPAAPGDGGGGRAVDADNNSTFQNATPVSMGPVTGTLSSENDQADFFRIQVSAGQSVYALLTINDYDPANPATVNFDMEAYGPYQTKAVSSTSTFRYETFTFLAISSGTHYLKVFTVAGSGSYRLDFTVAWPPELKSGDSVEGSLSAYGTRSSDWYRVYLSGGAKAQVATAVMTEDSGANFDLYLMDLWNEYSYWYNISWWSDPSESVSAAASYTGYYYLQVNAFDGTGKYRLSLSVSSQVTDNDNDPASSRSVKGNATLNGTLDQSFNHYDWYRVHLYRGERLSAVLHLKKPSPPADIFTLSVLYDNLSVAASNTNYIPSFGGQPVRLTSDIVDAFTAPAEGDYYVVAFAKVATRPGNPANLDDRNAWSDYALDLSMSQHQAVSNRPPFVSQPVSAVSFAEDTPYRLPLYTIFSDPDGDDLRYTVSGGEHLSISVGDPQPGFATLVPDENWTGQSPVTFTATDPMGQQVSQSLIASVTAVNDAPRIILVSPPSPVAMVPGSPAVITVTASDAEGDALAYSWLLDGVPLSVTGRSVSIAVNATGGHTLSVSVSDPAGGRSVREWSLQAEYPSDFVVVDIVSPLNDSRYSREDTVQLLALTVKGNEEFVRYEWLAGGRKVAEGRVAKIPASKLGTGSVAVTLRATSGGFSTERTVVVDVAAAGAASGLTMVMVYIVVVLLVVAVIGASAWRMLRARTEAERLRLERAALLKKEALVRKRAGGTKSAKMAKAVAQETPAPETAAPEPPAPPRRGKKAKSGKEAGKVAPSEQPPAPPPEPAPAPPPAVSAEERKALEAARRLEEMERTITKREEDIERQRGLLAKRGVTSGPDVKKLDDALAQIERMKAELKRHAEAVERLRAGVAEKKEHPSSVSQTTRPVPALVMEKKEADEGKGVDRIPPSTRGGIRDLSSLKEKEKEK